MNLMGAIGEFQSYLDEVVPPDAVRAGRLVHLGLGQRHGEGLPDARPHDHERDGPVHLGKHAETSRTANRPWPSHIPPTTRINGIASRLRRPSCPARSRRCCGGCPRSTRCSAPPSRRITSETPPCIPATESCCSTRPPTATNGGVRRPVPLRHHPEPQPTPRVRVRTARLHRSVARSARARSALRGDGAALHEPTRDQRARDRAERLRAPCSASTWRFDRR